MSEWHPRTSLRARYLWSGPGRMIEDGEVTLRGGRLEYVGPRRGGAAESRRDFGDAVLLPGIVNAHTHLELTHLENRLPPGPDFVDWLRRVYALAVRNPPNPEEVRAAARDGVMRSLRAGVTAVGDITRHAEVTRGVLRENALCAVSFGEVTAISRRRDGFAERLAAAIRAPNGNSTVVVGLSPHAPYTVEPRALRACGEAARNGGLPVCIHVAESSHEEEFTRQGTGPLADYLRELGVLEGNPPALGCSPIELLERCDLLSPGTVLAHANYVSDADIARIAKSGASVAYCPRTHAAFGHAPHCFRDMRAAGIRVAIGTDSLASNPSLSVLEELRFLHKCHGDVAPADLLEMGTRAGASATPA
jgi:cytosine/adenosine deaminase-related metal-dependent hydrolase